MDRYTEVSRRVMSVLERFSPTLEKLSLDEAFVDLTGAERSLGPSEPLGRRIKAEIREETDLVASVGIAPVKFVAKIASDLRKPDGLVVVAPGEVTAFLAPLPLSRLWGVGARTRARLEELGFRVIGDLAQAERRGLFAAFGKHGTHLQDLAQGRDERVVVPDRDARSYSHERTYARDQTDRDIVASTLLQQSAQVSRRLRRDAVRGRIVQLKLRDHAFHTVTRRSTRATATDDVDAIYATSLRLLDASWDGRPLRLVGVGVSGIVSVEGDTLDLFHEESDEKHEKLTEALDALESRFGRGAVFRAGTLRAREAGDTGSSLSEEQLP
jgi:DNA polymerase-4